jgi:isopentenyldiphosphate isomerase
MNELLDIVNEQDQIIDQMYRSEIYEKKLSCFRVINAFLIDDKKQVWIPRRTKHKKLFPLCLDASVGGHVVSGESYQQAFERELKEELNLDAVQCTYEIIAHLTPHEHNVSAFMQVYIIHTTVTPSYNTSDFESSQWIAISELQEKIENGEPTKGDLPLLVKCIEEHLLKNNI